MESKKRGANHRGKSLHEAVQGGGGVGLRPDSYHDCIQEVARVEEEDGGGGLGGAVASVSDATEPRQTVSVCRVGWGGG